MPCLFVTLVPFQLSGFMHVQIIRFLRSVFELPGIYLASPQMDYTEERVLILKLKRQWCNISFPSSDLI